MDPLNQLVDMLRPRALLWKRVAGRGDWAWRFPATEGVVFGRLVSGRCRFDLPGAGQRSLEAGDYLLLTRPSTWLLRGGDEAAAIVDFEEVFAQMSPERSDENDPELVRMVAGHFQFDSTNIEMLIAFLSPVVHLRASESSTRLNGVFALIDAEALDARPGQEAVLSRLLEIVLIELMRSPELLLEQQHGMLAGLMDPQIAPALRAFHTDIGQGWSVSSMAAAAHMSRSAFSERFNVLIGQPPMMYVLQWRMAVARDALRAGRQSIGDIALATGYGSASAFSTAFTRTVGRSPARFAREAG